MNPIGAPAARRMCDSSGWLTDSLFGSHPFPGSTRPQLRLLVRGELRSTHRFPGFERSADFRPNTLMLPAEQRLLANRDFRLVYAKGRSYANPIAVLYILRRAAQNAEAVPGRRIGFVVSKKQGGAVVRNRIKRRLREAVRARLAETKQGAYDLVIVGRSAAASADWEALEAALSDLMHRAGVLVRPRILSEQVNSEVRASETS